MPYDDERAGLRAIVEIAGSGMVEQFQREMVNRHTGEVLELPPFEPYPNGKARELVLAFDGSYICRPIPGALPSTEVGLVTVAAALINTHKLDSLQPLPESGAYNPADLRSTEDGVPFAAILPGMNAAKDDGTKPQTWFRQRINQQLEEIQLGDESFADTLFALLSADVGRKVRCPGRPECDSEDRVELPGPNERSNCPVCGTEVMLADGLRIHEQFEENASTNECHARYMDALELLALMNVLRYLAKTDAGINAIRRTAFVMDGPLAAFGTIAVLASSIHKELRRIQKCLGSESEGLLVMSGIKSGAFVRHVEDLDRAPEPGKRIKRERYWLPRNDYIRKHIVASKSRNSKPWGELTYFGRPAIVKTASGQRLVLNIAQPDADPPLTDRPVPPAMGDAIATADKLGVGADQFLPLRRVHAQAAIPFRAGTDLIRSLVP